MHPAKLIAAFLVAALAPAALASDVSSVFPDSARVKVAFSLPLELHNLLMVASQEGYEPAPGMEKQMAGYAGPIAVYKDAQGRIADPAAWRYINDAILEGPDIKAIAARATGAPASIEGPDADGVRKILTALGDAWPLFEKQDLDARRVSLQKVRLRLEKQADLFEPKVMPVVYQKLAFTIPDAPVTVYTVIEAVEAGVIGRTSAGYYLVIATARRPEMAILETMIHELTHLLDASQQDNQKSILRRVRAAAAGVSRREVEEMLHGLVSYNSGVVLKMFGKPDYTPLVNASPMGDKIAKYRSVFEGAWNEYLTGKIGDQQVVDALVASISGGGKTQTSSSRN